MEVVGLLVHPLLEHSVDFLVDLLVHLRLELALELSLGESDVVAEGFDVTWCQGDVGDVGVGSGTEESVVSCGTSQKVGL